MGKRGNVPNVPRRACGNRTENQTCEPFTGDEAPRPDAIPRAAGGLYLDVRLSDSRSRILRTTVKGKRTEIGLGELSTKTLATARKEATELRFRAKRGEDVFESRRIAKRAVPTLREATLKVHANLSATIRSDQHSKKWIRSTEQSVFPRVRREVGRAIKTPDVLAVVGPIWTRVPDTAPRALRQIDADLDYCQSPRYRNVIVAEGLALPLPNPWRV